MPYYDFKCPECKLIVEHKLPWTEEPKIMCDCGVEMHKCITSSPVRFLGSGFYENDYKGKL